MRDVAKMREVRFAEELFVNYRTGTILDQLLCSYLGLPKGVNYMVIGDPGVGKTTIVLQKNTEKMLLHARIAIVTQASV